MRTLLAVTTAALLSACASEVTPVLGCRAEFGLEPDCRFQNPEDIARVPGSDWLIVSQFGAMDGSRAGSLAAYQPSSGRLAQIFPTGKVADDRRWGDPSCPPPKAAEFAPHGIDLDAHPSGPGVLLVVDHGGREAVELFELETTSDGVAVHWRGCVLGPEDAYFNDVLARDDGGFFVSHMMPKSSQWLAQLRGGLLGLDTGFVYAWTQASGFEEVPGTRAPFPNGIEKSGDGRYLYLNSYLGDEVRKIELASGTVVARRSVARPDNSSWDESGRLLVASHTDSLMELFACTRLGEGACGFAFEILALDADTLEGFAWLAHRGAPMGAATVAVQLGDHVYLGSFAGDRVTRWKIPRP